jgi:hypothetical protein
MLHLPCPRLRKTHKDNIAAGHLKRKYRGWTVVLRPMMRNSYPETRRTSRSVAVGIFGIVDLTPLRGKGESVILWA